MIRMIDREPEAERLRRRHLELGERLPPNSIRTPSATGMAARMSSPIATVSSNVASDGASNSA